MDERNNDGKIKGVRNHFRGAWRADSLLTPLFISRFPVSVDIPLTLHQRESLPPSIVDLALHRSN